MSEDYTDEVRERDADLSSQLLAQLDENSLQIAMALMDAAFRAGRHTGQQMAARQMLAVLS